ncbi:MAG: YvcK family protein [Chloroflexi bacterium]|nr:YvcK family protein [Chloroflexota bacterium]
MTDNDLFKWLTPGIGIKRWLGLILAGAVFLGMAAAGLVIAFYRSRPAALWAYMVWLAELPLWLLIAILGAAGVLMVIVGVVRINRSILEPLQVEMPNLLDAMVERRQRKQGPRIVAIGGGTGLPTLLRGLKTYTTNITAVVTVADDGGSSGRLRRDMGVLPPGDFRNNIAALAKDEGLLTQLFQYRFGEGGLEGHSFGNLFITAMSEVTGSFESALEESSKVLAVRGQVLPSTLANVTLTAVMRQSEHEGTTFVVGESRIPEENGRIERVALQPDDIRAYPGSVRAILNADLIVFGPGSLFTSILPNLLVNDISEAVRASKAVKVYVCNVATQPGETDGFTVMDHVRAIEQHVGDDLFDVVIANNEFPPTKATYVQPNGSLAPSTRIVTTPLVDEAKPWRHDPEKLARALMALIGPQS